MLHAFLRDPQWTINLRKQGLCVKNKGYLPSKLRILSATLGHVHQFPYFCFPQIHKSYWYMAKYNRHLTFLPKAKTLKEKKNITQWHMQHFIYKCIVWIRSHPFWLCEICIITEDIHELQGCHYSFWQLRWLRVSDTGQEARFTKIQSPALFQMFNCPLLVNLCPLYPLYPLYPQIPVLTE